MLCSVAEPNKWKPCKRRTLYVLPGSFRSLTPLVPGSLCPPTMFVSQIIVRKLNCFRLFLSETHTHKKIYESECFLLVYRPCDRSLFLSSEIWPNRNSESFWGALLLGINGFVSSYCVGGFCKYDFIKGNGYVDTSWIFWFSGHFIVGPWLY